MADETTGRRRRILGRCRSTAVAVRWPSTCCSLPLGAAIALVWANTGPESYFRFSYAAAFVVNDVAMVFFFGLITKEVVQATAPGGVLHPWRRALLPVIASIGVTLVPTFIHTHAGRSLDEPMLASAWPVTFGDGSSPVAASSPRLIFGKHHSAIPFVILLAITLRCRRVWLPSACSIHPTRTCTLPAACWCSPIAMSVASGLRQARVEIVLAACRWDRARISWFAPVPERPASGAGAGADHARSFRTPRAIPASSSTPLRDRATR